MAAKPVLRHGVPVPATFEAPSSWISRLALVQGCSLKELLRFLQLDSLQIADLDRHILGPARQDLIQRCSLHPTAFAYAERAMSLPDASGPPMASVLTWRGAARFRYCPLCMAKESTPYLDIRWRISKWRHCLAHSCLLEDRCGTCGAYVAYPTDMAQSAAGRLGHANQRRCQRCTADLASVRPVFVDLLRPGVVTQIELYRALKSWPEWIPAPSADVENGLWASAINAVMAVGASDA